MRTAYPHKPLLSLLVLIATGLTTFAFSPSQYNSESVLKSGHWVRVKVSQNAIHQITYDQLREMGFSDPSKVTVYGYGGAVLTDDTFKIPIANPKESSQHPEDLPQIYAYRIQDRLLFYGECGVRPGVGSNSTRKEQGDTRINRYSPYGYYFLTDCQSIKSVPGISFNSSNTRTVTTHTSVNYKDFNDENPTDGGVFFFSRDIIANPDLTVDFDIENQDPSVSAYFCYYAVATSYSSTPTFTVTLPDGTDGTGKAYIEGKAEKLNSPNSKYAKCNGYQYFTTRGADDPETLNSFRITPKSPAPSYAAIDWAYLSYTRKNGLNGGSQCHMVFPGLRSDNLVVIPESSLTTEVWDITNPFYVRRFNLRYRNGETQFTPAKSYRDTENPSLHAVAFDYINGQFPTPEFDGVVPNQNLHALTSPDLLIVATETCRDQALRLAEAHRELQGLDVVVVSQQEIFNEFSSGTPTPMAYRRFAKMLYDRNPEKFRYMLLFGEGCFDNVGYIYPARDRLITYQVADYALASNKTTNYVADSYFGMLDDYYDPDEIAKTKMDIAVGRIPASNVSDAKSAVDKIITYLSTPVTQPYHNRALLMADDGDTQKHVSQSDATADTIRLAAPMVTTTKSYVNIYPLKYSKAVQAREKIIASLIQGQDYVCYTGHGGATSFTSEGLWSKYNVESTDYINPPFWMLATCDAFAFDRLDNGISEAMLYKANGGAIGVVAASRTVYADSNHTLSTSIANAYFSAKPGETIGDVYRNGRNASLAKSDEATMTNTLCYNLAGDPAIPVRVSDLTVTAATVNGVSTLDGTTIEMKPLTQNTVTGSITSSDGQVVESFNGSIVISIYDAPQPTNVSYSGTVPGQSGTQTVYVTLDESLLTEISVPVVNGKFSANIVIPDPVRPDQTNRMSFFAANDDQSLCASGYFNNLIVSTADAGQAIDDTTPPVISELYLDTPEFTDGDEVGSSTTLYATIDSDETGINNATGTVGGGSTLTIDGQKTYPVKSALSPQPDGSYTLAYPLSDLTDGRHTLRLSVTDNAGNHSSRSIGFTVMTRDVKAELIVDGKAARESIDIDIRHDFASTPTARLIIEDADGNIIINRENCAMPYTWDLKDSGGAKVADGIYRAYAIMQSGRQYSNTPKAEIVVIK